MYSFSSQLVCLKEAFSLLIVLQVFYALPLVIYKVFVRFMQSVLFEVTGSLIGSCVESFGGNSYEEL